MSYYFRKISSEFCHPKQYFLDEMQDENIKEMDIYKAKRITGQGIYYCHEYGESGEVGEGCGRDCDGYEPRNKKSGRCKHSGYCYEPDIIITIRNKRYKESGE